MATIKNSQIVLFPGDLVRINSGGSELLLLIISVAVQNIDKINDQNYDYYSSELGFYYYLCDYTNNFGTNFNNFERMLFISYRSYASIVEYSQVELLNRDKYERMLLTSIFKS